jgi:hypothetical protein
LVVTLAAALTVRPLGDADVWYHLAAGRLLWSTGRWPTTNTFSYTASEHPWIDLHWIFQLLLYGAHALGGANGCILLAMLLVVATVSMLYATARRTASPATAAGLLAIAVVIASPRLIPRPELLSFGILATYLWLLDDYPRCGRSIFALIPLQILWTNAQGIFPVGIALIASFWLGATARYLPLLPAGWRAASACTPRDWRRLTGTFVLAACGCLLNPYGQKGALFPLELLPRVTKNSFLSERIGEFRSPFPGGSYALPLSYVWLCLLVLCAVSFVLNFRRWHLGRLFAVGTLGLLSTQAQRNVALFGWVAVPVIAANIGGWLAQRRAARSRSESDSHQRLGQRVVEAVALATIGLLLVGVITNRFWKFLAMPAEFNLGVSRLQVPVEAVAFADAIGLSGTWFNCLQVGGYLTWSRYPADRVFVDGRLETYPESFLRTYFGVMDDPRGWPELAAHYGFDNALLYHTWSNRWPLARFLASGNGWELVYYDDVASIYLPVDAVHREIRERAEHAFVEVQERRRQHPPITNNLWNAVQLPLEEIERQRGLGGFLRAIGRPAEARSAYQRVLALAPDESDVRFSLGLAYWQTGERQQATGEWREILRHDPSYERARAALQEADRARH